MKFRMVLSGWSAHVLQESCDAWLASQSDGAAWLWREFWAAALDLSTRPYDGEALDELQRMAGEAHKAYEVTARAA